MKTKKTKNPETDLILEELEELQEDSTKTKPPAHYVDNKKFLAALIDYKASIDAARVEGKPTPQVTKYIGECFIKIATHLSYKSNFINYTFKDEALKKKLEYGHSDIEINSRALDAAREAQTKYLQKR